jgi:hypothetical protein
VILADEPIKDRCSSNLIVGKVDHRWGLGFGLGWCELAKGPVWPRGIEMVQVAGEDPA